MKHSRERLPWYEMLLRAAKIGAKSVCPCPGTNLFESTKMEVMNLAAPVHDRFGHVAFLNVHVKGVRDDSQRIRSTSRHTSTAWSTRLTR